MFKKGDKVIISGVSIGHGEEWNGRIGVVVCPDDEKSAWVTVKGHDADKKRQTVFHLNHLKKAF